jgi:hypothetical protein
VACSTVATSGFLMFTPKDHDARASGDRTFFGQSGVRFSRTTRPVVSFLVGVLNFTPRSGNFMSYIITGRDSAGALSLKRDSAAAAIKKAVELMGDGCRDVCITDADGHIYGHAEFDQLRAASGERCRTEYGTST